MKKLLLLPCSVLLLLVCQQAAAQWSPSVLMSTMSVSASLNENMTSCLAVSGDTVHVVWCDHRTGGNSIWYRRSTDDGQTWNTEVAITDTSGHATFPTVAVSGNYVHVAWMETLATSNASFYMRSIDGGNTWQAPVCLDSVTKFWPGIAADANNVVLSLNKELVVGNTEVYYINSTDNGTTWNPEQRVSFATDRSEDPSINVLGNDVHLSWNDKRSGAMNIYYRHSPDLGVSWDPETPLTNVANPQTCYTSMVCLADTNVDVPYGYNMTGNFDAWLRQSTDVGSTWTVNQPLSATTAGEVYPYMCRSGSHLHVLCPIGSVGVHYLYSANGGNTWAPAYFLNTGSQCFIKYNGCTLHVIYTDASKIYYRRNPTGNCIVAGVEDATVTQSSVHVYPNPFHTSAEVTVPFSKGELKIYNVLGEEVLSQEIRNQKSEIRNEGFSPGIYFYKAISKEGELDGKVIVE